MPLFRHHFQPSIFSSDLFFRRFWRGVVGSGLEMGGVFRGGGGFGFSFHAADAGGNEYIPSCDPPGNPVSWRTLLERAEAERGDPEYQRIILDVPLLSFMGAGMT